MLSVILGIAIVVPVVGALLYAFFASDSKRQPARRITAFGEAPEGDWDDLDRRLA
ncbi:MAG: hypothetical protein ACO1SV_21260 [Fimbriimonas sp.]